MKMLLLLNCLAESIEQAEPITDWLQTIWEFLNNPLPIVCMSIIEIGLFVIVFISRTSFGKKNIKKLKERASNVETTMNETKQDMQKAKEQLDNQIIVWQKQINDYKQCLQIVMENSKNVKVKKAVQELLMKEKEIENGNEESKEN